MSKTLILILCIYLFLINLTGLILMGTDKKRAIRSMWRIPEKTFFIVSLLGGSLGTFAGMYLFRHKTKHWYFVVFMPMILAMHVVALILWLVSV